MHLRTLLFWSHLTAGVTAGLVILVMSTTGVLLTYERQLIEWSDRGYRDEAPAPGAECLPVETLLARFAEQHPDQAPTAIALRADPAAPAIVTLGRTTIYQHPYTGQLLGPPSADMRDLMSRVRAWHRWLAMDGEGRAIGKAISGWSSVLFLFVVLSGLYLWLPRKWSWPGVRAVVLLRGGLRGKARDFNWHNVLGIWSAVPLAIVIATALPISFPWANALVYRLAGETPPSGGIRRTEAPGRATQVRSLGGLNRLWTRAEQQVPGWRTISLRLPEAAGAPAVFAIDRGTGGQPQHRSTLTLDAATGAVVAWEPFESQSAGRRLRSWTRFTHTGEYYGLVGQTMAGAASGGAAILVLTGLALALRRLAATGDRFVARARATTRRWRATRDARTAGDRGRIALPQTRAIDA